MSDPMVSITDLWVTLGELLIFEKFEMQVQQGEVLGLVGESGRGKTTLMRIVAGLEKNYQGRVSTAFQRLAYVFQDVRLLPWLNAAENVALPLMADLGHAKALDRAHEYLRQMKLERVASHTPAQLSGGMAQRVGIARALAYRPDMLLLDEPFSALDENLRHHLLPLVKRAIRREKTTAIYISHNPLDMNAMADRIIQI